MEKNFLDWGVVMGNITKNVRDKANLIWSVADKLTGVYKPH